MADIYDYFFIFLNDMWVHKCHVGRNHYPNSRGSQFALVFKHRGGVIPGIAVEGDDSRQELREAI